ncbi:response regulator [Alkalihalobacillus sp. LMS39]|uniref:response regulator transcription factor n=1 Tax=Alkalihalobacillus sp. LMS39 TaxID=2924032 RepID=UPI0032600B4B
MNKSILIVDDEPLTLQGIKKTLESWSNGKYEIIAASNATMAMEWIDKKKVHLLITDICMPEITGLHMLKLLKQKGLFPVTLIVCAHSDFSYAQEAIELGVINYLLKPISKQKLVEEVEKALQVEEKNEKLTIIEKVMDAQLLHLKLNDQSEKPVSKAMHYVNANVNKPFNLKDVAQHVHLNPSYFSALFKEQTNLTFSEYVTRIRIQKAKNLLLTSDLSIEEVAEAVGYSSAKYLIKIFREYEGVTPSKYKRK